jgi:mannose-6-phosphate isomerase-like protein (cupin superfamily)
VGVELCQALPTYLSERTASGHGSSLEYASPIEPAVLRTGSAPEFLTEERCFISEWSNSEADPSLSVARVRVEPGVATRWHALDGIAERYVILEGAGQVEVGGSIVEDVGPFDVILIPAGVPQRIRNIGTGDLVFLALCTPPFEQRSYRDLGR